MNALRPLFLLLVLANMLLFAAGRGYFGRIDGGTEAARLEAQIQPERLRLAGEPHLTAQAAKTEPPVEEEAAPAAPQGCLAGNDFTPAQALVLAEWLRTQRARVSMTQQVLEEASTWWVYLPPVRERGVEDKRGDELRRIGIKDFYIIQDAGPHYRAISLGVFKSESKAEEALAILSRKGVKNAKAGPRDVTARVDLRFTGDASALAALSEKAAGEKPPLTLSECAAQR